MTSSANEPMLGWENLDMLIYGSWIFVERIVSPRDWLLVLLIESEM